MDGQDLDYIKLPLNGEFSGCYLVSDDGKLKIPTVTMNPDPAAFAEVKQSMKEYKWRDGDFLLATFPKNGTHLTWEIMMMLLRDSPDYIQHSKCVLMMDLYPISKGSEVVPSPKAVNTHFRLDVLPEEFRNQKTVFVIRNPKDTAISFYHHWLKWLDMFRNDHVNQYLDTITFPSFLRSFLLDSDSPYGRYFDYIDYMWTLKDRPNLLLLYYEDIIEDPVSAVGKLNDFMDTGRSPELVKQIADAIRFSNMKAGKLDSSLCLQTQFVEAGVAPPPSDDAPSENTTPTAKPSDGEWPSSHFAYRKGIRGDWKNHYTVADNELFDAFLNKWETGKEIPFRY